MKKIFDKNKIITMILCFSFFIMGVKANQMYNANEIYYQPTDSNWNVSNVNTALNSLKTDYDVLKTAGTATASSILAGYNAIVKGTNISGTMINKSNSTTLASYVTENGDNVDITIPSAGYYDTTSKISVPFTTIYKVGNGVRSLGSKSTSGTGTKTLTFSATGITDYTSLTASNFVASLTNVTVNGDNYHSNIQAGGNLGSISYNASTGQVSVTVSLFNNRESIGSISATVSCTCVL